MANITDICNMALAFLSKGRIASIDENSEAARQCKLFYDVTRQHLLRDYSWGFAKRVTKLAELDNINPQWEHLYAYPNKCLCVRKIFMTEDYQDEYGNEKKRVVKELNNDDRTKWEICMVSDNITAIGCDIEKAWMEYTYDVNDSTVFASDFIEAFAHLLASNMAMQLTGNMQLHQSNYNQSMAILQRAKYTTAAEKVEKPEYPDKYFSGRG